LWYNYENSISNSSVENRQVYIITFDSGKPFFIFINGWIDAFVVRATDRIGKGIRTPPRDALIADSVSESISGKAFGIHRTIDQMGAIAGPIVAFVILQFMDIQAVFLLSV